jgi:8-oxo-dGTP diphosphatase
MINVVVGILFNNQNQILIAKRPLGKSFAGLWEFPGGKIEANETPLMALHREFLEEVRIELSNNLDKITAFHEKTYVQQPNELIHLLVFKITEFKGEPIGAEGQEIKWVNQCELTDYDFLTANEEIIKLLMHPKNKTESNSAAR